MIRGLPIVLSVFDVERVLYKKKRSFPYLTNNVNDYTMISKRLQHDALRRIIGIRYNTRVGSIRVGMMMR